MGESIGIGIVGSGFMGQTYARAVTTQVEGAHFVAVAGGTRAPKLAAEYGVPCMESPEALVHTDGLDLVLIATPHAAHAAHAQAAAQAGKHVLIDKPMACSTAECDAILTACDAAGVQCGITFTQRYRTTPREAKRLLDTGRLGAVRHIRSVQIVPEGMDSAVPAWQLRPENVGILLGHGIHNIDQARWFTGQEVAAVYAKTRNLGKPYDVDGTADVVLTMADGTVCYCFCSFEPLKPGFPHGGGSTQVICERGLLDVDWYGDLRVSEDGGDWYTAATQQPVDWAGKGFLDPVRLEAYAAAIQALVDAIRSNAPLPATGWDGRQAVAAAEAAYRSSQEGREILLEP